MQFGLTYLPNFVANLLVAALWTQISTSCAPAQTIRFISPPPKPSLTVAPKLNSRQKKITPFTSITLRSFSSFSLRLSFFLLTILPFFVVCFDSKRQLFIILLSFFSIFILLEKSLFGSHIVSLYHGDSRTCLRTQGPTHRPG